MCESIVSLFHYRFPGSMLVLPHQAAIAATVPSRARPALQQRGRAAATRARALGRSATRTARSARSAWAASVTATRTAPRAASPAVARARAVSARPALARLALGAPQGRLTVVLTFSVQSLRTSPD